MHIFVRRSGELYGQIFCVHNVHNLLHLGDDVRHFQCSVNQLFTFPFENFLQSLKRLVHSGPNQKCDVECKAICLPKADATAIIISSICITLLQRKNSLNVILALG